MNVLNKKLLSHTLLWVILSLLFLLAPMAFWGADSVVMVFIIMLSLVFLLISYRSPWALIALLILAPSSFFYLLDINFLPAIKITQGIRINFLDILILCVLAIGTLRFFARRRFPLFGWEILFLLASFGLSLIWGLSQRYVDFDAALGGLRQLAAFILYISLVPILYRNQNKEHLINLLIGIVIISMGIQVYEILTGARLILSTSTPGFYSETRFLPVGGLTVPYLWNRMSAILFLVYFICLARWFVIKSKVFLLLAVAIFICIALTLIRSLLIFISLGSLFLALLVYFTHARSREIIFTSIFFGVLLGMLLVLIGIATNSVGATRLATLVDPLGDSSFNVRIQSTQIFYEYFLKSPLVGSGPGSIGLIELKHGIWATDVGLISSLAGYGLLAFFSLYFLLAKVFKSIKYALQFEKSALEISNIYGISSFFFVAIVSFFSVQNFFFLSPWNISTAVALVILDSIVRSTRKNMFLAQHTHLENGN